jgi:hypothetical protein
MGRNSSPVLSAESVAAAVIASQLVTRIGTRRVQLGGTVISVMGLILLSRADTEEVAPSTYSPGLVLSGVGIISVGVPAEITAVVDVTGHHAGSAKELDWHSRLAETTIVETAESLSDLGLLEN